MEGKIGLNLKRAEQLQKNQTPEKLAAISEARRVLEAAGIIDVRRGYRLADYEKGIAEAVAEFKSKPLTTESVTNYWQKRWDLIAEKRRGVDLGKFRVPTCNRSTENLIMLKNLPQSRKMVYAPDNFFKPGGLKTFAELYPETHCYLLRQGGPVWNKSNEGGWFDIEESFGSPYAGESEEEIKAFFGEQGISGQRLATYVIGSQDSKDQTDHYFDEETWSLLGSTFRGHKISIHTSPTGAIHVFPSKSVISGHRSEGAKRDFDPLVSGR